MQATDIDLMQLDPFVSGTDGDLFVDEPGEGRGFWSLTRYDDVKAAGLDWQTFSNAQGTQIQDRRAEGHGKPSIHNMDPPRHKLLRRLLVADFTRDRVQRMEPRAREVVRAHLDDVLAAGSCDLVATLTHHVPILVFACDTAPELLTEAPKGMVQIARYFGTEYLRPDLERAIFSR